MAGTLLRLQEMYLSSICTTLLKVKYVIDFLWFISGSMNAFAQSDYRIVKHFVVIIGGGSVDATRN